MPKTTAKRLSRNFFVTAASFLLGLNSCTPRELPPELKVSEDPTPPEVEPTPSKQVQALDAVTGGAGPLAEAVLDVRLMLLAEAASASGDEHTASQHWFAALAIAQDQFGKRALEGWVRSYVKALGKKSDPQVLARLLLAETQGGRHSAYMLAKGLTNEDEIIKQLVRLVPESLPSDAIAEATPPSQLKPSGEGVPSDDPLLVKTTQKNCAAIQLSIADWQTWLAQRGPAVQRYFNALIQQCSGQSSEAVAGFKAVSTALAANPTTQPLAVEASSRVVAMERALGRRTAAADSYLELMKFWELPGVKPETMGLNEIAFALRRIDETLWAARYRALIGDYENAKIFAQAALTQVANAYAAKAVLSSQIKEDLATLRAEAYHVLAYRIAVEQRQWQSAIALNRLALQSVHLNREWKERLLWFIGLYEYLSGNFDAAKRRWEQLLGESKDDSMRAMVYFWLAKTYDQLGQAAESSFYLSAIVEDYPLNFYAVVAPEVANLKGGKDWRRLFGDPRRLEENLRLGTDFQLQTLRQQPDTARLLMRAELLVAAEGLRDWAGLAVDELDAIMAEKLSQETETSAFVYLSRLHYNVGHFRRVISLTNQLAKNTPGFWQRWQEQLLLYFPRPYRDIYERNAFDNDVDTSLLLGISRQESAFVPNARSSASAMGLMQLIKPTAARFAPELGFAEGELDTLLLSPPANIRLGSRYLKTLNLLYKGFQPAVYAGYNAGEPAVDVWLERRAHSDPLMFIELIPFGETKDYIKNVWRNVVVYDFLKRADSQDWQRTSRR